MRRIQPRILSTVSFATLAIAGLPAIAHAQGTETPADCSTYSTQEEREACLAQQSEDAGVLPSATPTGQRDEAIVITGTRIRSDFTSPDPLTIINPDVAFQEGQNQTAEMIQSAPPLVTKLLEIAPVIWSEPAAIGADWIISAVWVWPSWKATSGLMIVSGSGLVKSLRMRVPVMTIASSR